MKHKPYLTQADVNVLLQGANDFAEKKSIRCCHCGGR